MKELLIIAGLTYLFVENFSIEIKTNNDNINNALNLPGQIPLSDIVTGRRKDSQQNFIQVYLAPNDKTKLLN